MASRAWEQWKAFNRAVVDFQSRILLQILYGTLLMPFALIARALSNPMANDRAAKASHWIPVTKQSRDLPSARRQF